MLLFSNWEYRRFEAAAYILAGHAATRGRTLAQKGESMFEDPDKMLLDLFKALGLSSPGPRSANPKTFETSARIVDDECLLAVTKALELVRRQQALSRELNLASQEANVANGRLFNLLRKKYPHVQTENIPESQVGLRKWEGDWYFVGWEEKE